MEKSKIVRVLQTFTEAELEAFREFTGSPYFNKREELVRLLAILTGPDDRLVETGLGKEDVFQRLFPGAPYDDKQLRYLVSDLTRLAERFLSLRKYEEDGMKQDLDLLACYLARELDKDYQQVKRRIETGLEAARHKNAGFFQNQLLFAEIQEMHFGKQLARKFDPTIQYASNFLDCYYFLKKLEFSCAMLDRQSVLKGEYQLNLPGHLLAYIRENNFFQQDLIALYYTVLQALLEEENEAHFDTLRHMLNQRSAHMSPLELKAFYTYGINYCARKIRQGKEQYVGEALTLYMDGINREILIEKRHLSPWTFTNVVKLALRLRKYEWIEQFIGQFSELLPGEFRQNALHYNLAELYYYTRDFGKALRHLNQVKLSDLNFHLGSRVILAKVYYESDEEEALLSLIAAFSIFLKRNRQISNQLKKTYLNFCSILFQIVKGNPRKMAALTGQINQTSHLTDRSWLFQVLEEKMGRRK